MDLTKALEAAEAQLLDSEKEILDFKVHEAKIVRPDPKAIENLARLPRPLKPPLKLPCSACGQRCGNDCGGSAQ
jgi:hypothetical protein